MDQFIVLNYETTFNTATFQFRVDPIDGKPSEIIDNLKFCVSPTEVRMISTRAGTYRSSAMVPEK